MSIHTLQREALERSPEFNNSVHGIVVKTALYRSGFLPPAESTTPAIRQTYAQIVRDPARYGFVPAIVAESTWNLTYDAWASDPAAGGSAERSD